MINTRQKINKKLLKGYQHTDRESSKRTEFPTFRDIFRAIPEILTEIFTPHKEY